jgi:hypothetical protein
MPESKGGGFWWMFQLLSAVMSTLAIVALARHAFVKWSLAAPMALVMDAYNAMMQLLFGWAHPYLQAALTWLGSFIGWRPTLYPHWKDVIVVIGLPGISGGRVSLRKRGLEGFVFAITAVVGAFITGLVAGLLQLHSPDFITQVLIAASLGLVWLPFFGFVAIAERDALALLHALFFGTLSSAAAALLTWLLSLTLGSIAGLGLASLAICMIIVGAAAAIAGMVLFWFAFREARFGLRADAVRKTKDDAREVLMFGLSILGGFIGAFCFFAIDAGLKLLMG